MYNKKEKFLEGNILKINSEKLFAGKTVFSHLEHLYAIYFNNIQYEGIATIKISDKFHSQKECRNGSFAIKIPAEISHEEVKNAKIFINNNIEVNVDLLKNIYVHKENIKNIIVSDIDDTIIKSQTYSKLLLIKNTLLTVAIKRRLIDTTFNIFKLLQNINTEYFFLSNSEKNLIFIIKEFLRENKSPKANFFLIEWTFAKRYLKQKKLYVSRHKETKLEFLKNFYPKAKFVLIGDCHQADPKIYLNFAEKYPEFVTNIYLRATNYNKKKQKLVLEKLKKYNLKLYNL